MSDEVLKIDEQGPKGLGGWLILPGIGLVISPFLFLYGIVNDFLPVFRNGVLEKLADPNFPAYHPLWVPLIWFDFLGAVVLLLLNLYLITLYFGKSPRFPLLAILYLSVNFFIEAVSYLGAVRIPAMADGVPAIATHLFKAILTAGLWIPYFSISKRVKNTFTAKMQVQSGDQVST